MKRHEAIIAGHQQKIEPVSTGVIPDLSGMKPFAALLLDVYGTLLVSRAGEIGPAEENAAPETDLTDLLQRYEIHRTPGNLNNALKKTISQAHAESKKAGIEFPEVDIVRIWQTVLGIADSSGAENFALEYEMRINPVALMPGAEKILSLCQRIEIPVGIISNAQFYTISLLKWFFGEDRYARLFDSRLLFFSWQEGHAKPSARMFEQARAELESMEIPAGSVLYVGNDMRNDILPAAAVGFSTAIFAGDRRSLRMRKEDPLCRGIQPDSVVTQLEQLAAGFNPPPL
jgi:putative hydrolase of the HAD superfamily